MSLQNDVNGLIELSEKGVSKINEYPNAYSPSTRPIKASERDWSTWSVGSLWIGIMVSIAVYMLASGLIVSGMSWWQALITIVLGHTLVMIPAVITGHFGTKYGLTFPMMSKIVFGIRGSLVPTIVRAFLGCFWFGVQSWIGGQAVNAIIAAIFSGWNDLGFSGFFISFLIFWAMNLYIAASGSTAIKKLEEYSAPALILLSFVVIIWALNLADWSIITILNQPAVLGSGDNFWLVFFPALSAMIAFDGTIALNMPDFTRHCKNQKSQFLGQLLGAPIMTAFIVFVGICGTSASYMQFGEAIWEPAILVSKFENPLVVIFFSIFIILATITTNVAANLVPPSLVFSTIFSKKLDYKKAVILAATLALLTQPWKSLEDPNGLIFNVCAILGSLLGPITGLYIASYLFEHKTKVDLVDLYRLEGGKYGYFKGVNVAAVIIFVVSTFVVILGKFVPSLKFVFDNSYVIGILGTAILYFMYLKLFRK